MDDGVEHVRYVAPSVVVARHVFPAASCCRSSVTRERRMLPAWPTTQRSTHDRRVGFAAMAHRARGPYWLIHAFSWWNPFSANPSNATVVAVIIRSATARVFTSALSRIRSQSTIATTATIDQMRPHIHPPLTSPPSRMPTASMTMTAANAITQTRDNRSPPILPPTTEDIHTRREPLRRSPRD